MEHARKMVLIPHENVERLQATLANGDCGNGDNCGSVLKTGQTPANVMTRLDAEMSDILNSSTYKSEREKWAQYRAVLQRYLHFKDINSYNNVRKNYKEPKNKISNDNNDNSNYKDNNKI